MGRPRKEINQAQFESLCGIMCTLEEIAYVLGCSGDTIERWCKRTYKETYAECYKRFSAKGKMSIRRAQYNAGVVKGNTSMLIWLGKQYLGQTDKNFVEQVESETDPLSKAFEVLENED